MLRVGTTSGIAKAEWSQADHLAPEHPFFLLPLRCSRYLIDIEALLKPAEVAATRSQAVVFCLPSFDPEWALAVRWPKYRSVASVILQEATASIWLAEGLAVDIARYEMELDRTITADACQIWRAMLEQIADSDCDGLDGVSYHFVFEGHRSIPLVGQTWSPDPRTNPGHLVTLCECLRQYAKGNSTMESVQGEIQWFREQTTLLTDPDE